MADPFLFISHVSEDHAAAGELVAELERRQVRCWIAPRDIRPGHPYDDEIAEAIDGCAAMLLVFSDRCNESDYIRREITVAGEARKLVIPFRIEDAQPKRGLRVRLADLHWIDGFIAREQAIDTLLAVLPGEPQPVRPAAPPPPVASERFPPDDLLRRAESGDASAQHRLGIAYLTAPWEKQDHDKAFHWLSKSAEQGHVLGQTCLGVLYQNGNGTPRNMKLALHWYGRAADQDYDVAHRNLGAMHEKGLGGPADPERALFHYRRARELGHPEAAADVERVEAALTPLKTA